MNQVVTSLARGVTKGYLDMYADAAARYLATHLLCKANEWPAETLARDDDAGFRIGDSPERSNISITITPAAFQLTM